MLGKSLETTQSGKNSYGERVSRPREKKSRTCAENSSSSHPETIETEDVEILDKRPIGQKTAKEAARKKINKKKGNDVVVDTWTKFEDLAKRRL